MSQRVLLPWFKVPKDQVQVAWRDVDSLWRLVQDFLEQRGCVVEFLPLSIKHCKLTEYDAYIYVPNDPMTQMGTWLGNLLCKAVDSERLNGRPRVFKIWFNPEAMIRGYLNGQKKLEREWPPGWFGPPTNDEKELLARATKKLPEDERELLFRRETQTEALSRLSAFLDALPVLT